MPRNTDRSSGIPSPTAFPADIPNSLRRHAMSLLSFVRLLSHCGHITGRNLFFADRFHEVHGRPIVGTSDSGNRVRFIRDSVLAQYEVSAIVL